MAHDVQSNGGDNGANQNQLRRANFFDADPNQQER
jgi:hypothetical protein